MKGVGKFGTVMADEAKGDPEASLAKARRIVGAGGRQEAKADLILADLVKHFPHFTWVGLYAVEGEELVLRAWKGPQPTRHVRIPVGEGLCGLAARTGETVLVPDVTQDARYMACFPSTRSEIVVPVLRDGTVVGEIDVDSDVKDAFTDRDRRFLEALAAVIEPLL